MGQLTLAASSYKKLKQKNLFCYKLNFPSWNQPKITDFFYNHIDLFEEIHVLTLLVIFPLFGTETTHSGQEDRKPKNLLPLLDSLLINRWNGESD
jgi:hypothetical protein